LMIAEYLILGYSILLHYTKSRRKLIRVLIDVRTT